MKILKEITKRFQRPSKLYILGNGFDRAHDLPTGYWDYKKYLEQFYPSLIKDYEKFIFCNSTSSDKWSDLENNLFFDYSKWEKYACKKYDFDFEVEKMTQFIFDFTGKAFLDWIADIDISNITKTCKISRNSKFITFNYTNVLEEYYHINKNHILHIHGDMSKVEHSALVNDDIIISHRGLMTQEEFDVSEAVKSYKHNNSIIKGELQFGSPRNKYKKFQDHLEMLERTMDKGSLTIDGEEGYIHAAEFCSAVYKNLESNYKKMKLFLNFKVSEVVIYGHSFMNIDEPYYRDIIIPLLKNRKWIFYYFNADAEKEIDDFIIKYSLRTTKKIHYKEFFKII